MSVDVLEGTPAAPPRSNGELVFEAPWQARAFGLAADLVAEGHFSWDEFRSHLIEAIAGWESAHPQADQPSEQYAADATPDPWDYYRCWLTALESAVVAAGLAKPESLAKRAHDLAARPTAHDH